MDGKVEGLVVKEDGMECSDGVEKSRSIVRVKVKKKRKPEEPLPVLSEESSDDEGGSVHSVVLREVEFKVLVKFKNHGGVTEVILTTLARDLESKVGEVDC